MPCFNRLLCVIISTRLHIKYTRLKPRPRSRKSRMGYCNIGVDGGSSFFLITSIHLVSSVCLVSLFLVGMTRWAPVMVLPPPISFNSIYSFISLPCHFFFSYSWFLSIFLILSYLLSLFPHPFFLPFF